MQCPAVVNEKATGMMRYALDDLMNPKTYMETRFGLVRYTGVLEANECADLTMAGGKLAAGMRSDAGRRHARFVKKCERTVISHVRLFKTLKWC